MNWPPIENSELSPDGNRIVYSMQAHDRWEVNVMTADGSVSTGITSPDPVLSILLDVVDHNVAPTWSNDSQKILFLSDRNGKWEFFVMNADWASPRFEGEEMPSPPFVKKILRTYLLVIIHSTF